MKGPPHKVGEIDLGRGESDTTPAPGGRRLAVLSGTLVCWDSAGRKLWTSHPPGLNFVNIRAIEDCDGDGAYEIALEAGRPTPPYGAAALVSLADGHLIWRYDVDPMSYSWRLEVGRFLPDQPGKQLVVLMQGYPPDPKNGYIAIFACPGKGKSPQQQWRHDFAKYTCFPTLLRADLDGDGVEEIAVETHSRMWLFDAVSGKVKQFLEWDVAPANNRSYGLVRFMDLNGDGLPDFLCIANFAQHHEVLLNHQGVLRLAWVKGWPESVTTGKVATRWPEPPAADLDGDGVCEVVVSMYNADGDSAWQTRIYDAVTGQLKQKISDLVATAIIKKDGKLQIFGNRCKDPAGLSFQGARLFSLSGQTWSEDSAIAEGDRLLRGTVGFRWQDGQLVQQSSPAVAGLRIKKEGPTCSLLAADLDGDGRCEIVVYEGQTARAYKGESGRWRQLGQWLSSAEPALADFDGDGVADLVRCEAHTHSMPVVEVVRLAGGTRSLWRTELPPITRSGLPNQRKAYLRLGHFTGQRTPDVYMWAGIPLGRSFVLEGKAGKLVWEKGEIPNTERFWAPTMNYASALDFNRDGCDDLVFTNPDYYCVADGRTGAFLSGPSWPVDIFHQKSQGLYTFPAILGQTVSDCLVALAGGHYFQGVMTVKAQPKWFRVPEPGENRAAEEGFLQQKNGQWLMGFCRQNGNFACVGLLDGKLHFELPLQAQGTDVISGDVDGDGEQEFVFGTSHGEIWAVGERQGRAKILWKLQVGKPVRGLILADVRGSGRSDLIVATADGRITVYCP